MSVCHTNCVILMFYHTYWENNENQSEISITTASAKTLCMNDASAVVAAVNCVPAVVAGTGHAPAVR